jgi:glycosyltransferase involved in cell wall biosynthesis
VVIGYNQEDFVPLAIQSVLCQTHRKLECILVDDGSSDATVERARSLAQTDPRLRVLTKENGGPASARNFGARAISSESAYVAFLDGDDVLHPQFITSLLAYLEENPKVGVVIPAVDFIDAQGAPMPGHRRGFRWAPSSLWLWPRRLTPAEPLTPFVTFYCGNGAFPFWLARASAYRKTEGWDDDLWFFADVDLLCQLAMVTDVHSIETKLVSYRIHSKQSTQGALPASPSYRHATLNDVQLKWNQRRFADVARNRRIDRACIYYRQIHLPLRALWVARSAFRELAREPSLRSLTWFLKLLYLFCRDLLYFKLFFWRSSRRYAATRFYEATASAARDVRSVDGIVKRAV